ncbi:MAG: holo-ACP synthase [Pseudonocardiales bacterium]
MLWTEGGCRARRLASRIRGTTPNSLNTKKIGVDVVHIPTWARCIEVGGQKLLERTYCPGELDYSAGRVDRLSTRFAAKEAVLKVLGTGIRGVGLRDVEVVSAPHGKPSIILHGPASHAAQTAGLDHVEVSLCHEDDLALAVAIGIGAFS